MSFFSTVTAFATPFAKAGVTKDPIAVARTKFVAVCSAQIKLIEEGKDKGYCFVKVDGVYRLTLKNGASALNAANPTFAVESVGDAVKFFDGAKEAAKAGEFDELFKLTARKMKAKEGAVVDGDAAGGVDHSASNAGIAAALAADSSDAGKQDEPAKGAAKGKKK